MRLSLHLKEKIKSYFPHAKKFYNRKLGIKVVSNYLKHYGKLPKKVSRSRGISGYMLFVQDFRSKNPTASFPQMGKEWVNSSEEQKDQFKARASEKNQYSKEDSARKIIERYFFWIYDFVFG